MGNFSKFFLSLTAAAFISASPVIGADLSNLGVKQDAKPDMGSMLKEKASNVVEEAKDKTDSTAEKLQEALGKKKENTADQAKKEMVDVKEETVTVQTPQGETQATEITVSPEGAAPAK